MVRCQRGIRHDTAPQKALVLREEPFLSYIVPQLTLLDTNLHRTLRNQCPCQPCW